MKIGVPKLAIGLVDVRDVAEAHYQAGFNTAAQGRYITSAHDTNFLELAGALRPKYGDEYPLPKNALPKWLLTLVGPLVDKRFSRRFIRNNVNVTWRADNTKIKTDLGIQFRPMRETMEDAFEVLVQNEMV
jgi:nucleoside-diphosphate-sugar epimerase